MRHDHHIDRRCGDHAVHDNASVYDARDYDTRDYDTRVYNESRARDHE